MDGAIAVTGFHVYYCTQRAHSDISPYSDAG